MGLRLKFNLVLVVVFVLGLAISGALSYRLLHQNAREQVIENAGVMMAGAVAIRGYTVEQIRPHLELQLMRQFLPESVPAYSATEVFARIRNAYPEYTYKEATLNPTNLRNRALDWEADIVNEFRNDLTKKELVGDRESSSGRSLYLARPLQVKSDSCIECHGVPKDAPKTMIERYGDTHGFGWKIGEIIGAQIVSVPLALPIKKANEAFFAFIASLFGVAVVVFVVLNIMLTRIVIRPITKLSHIADEVSKGNMNIPEFIEQGRDEVSILTSSFNRMRRSLEQAMKMIE